MSGARLSTRPPILPVALTALVVAGLGAWWWLAPSPSGVDDPPHVPAVPATTPAWSAPIAPHDPAQGSPSLALDTTPFSLTLPSSNRPDDDPAVRTRFTFRDPEPMARAPGVVEIALPFPVPRTLSRFAPEGMTVWVDEQPARFDMNLRGPLDQAMWTLTAEGMLRVRARPSPSVVHLAHPALEDTLLALEPSGAPADPTERQAWSRRRVLRHGVTRAGLVLPAPAIATWSQVTLPPGATFRAWPTLVPAPSTDRADGVRFVLTLHDGDTELHRATFDVDAEGGSTGRWSVDLSTFGGRTVDLAVHTEPRDNRDADYAFLGTPRVDATVDRTPRRVVVIGIDTLRPDHLGMYGYDRPTSPELDLFAQDAVVFDRAWTTAPRTRPAFRASTTGRRPPEAVCARPLGGVFRDHGYVTAGIVSNVHLNPKFGFDEGFDVWWLDHKADVETQVTRAWSWLQDHAHDDAYLFLHIMDPHIFYVPPDPWRSRLMEGVPPLGPKESLPDKFNRWQVYKWMTQDRLTDGMKAHTIARYDGEIGLTSHHLGRLLARIDALPGETTIVIHNDHGEEFWDHGGFEHNHALYDEVTRAVMVIRPPGGPGTVGARSDAMASLEDIAPTVWSLAGIPESDWPVTDGVSLVPALRGEPMDPDRAVGIAHLKYDRDQWGVVWRDHKYILTTADGREELYDLRSDPDEQHNLADTTDTAPWVEALGRAHARDAGPGWRIEVEIPADRTLTLTFPTPALAADILDPERVSDHPANQVWGETPRLTPADIGRATLSEDGRTLRVVGGRIGQGRLWVRFPEDVDVETLIVKTEGRPEEPARGGRMRRAGWSVIATAGPVLVPGADEAERIAACQGADRQASQGSTDAHDGATMGLLEALGYVGGGEDHD